LPRFKRIYKFNRIQKIGHNLSPKRMHKEQSGF
jgi:hypothetical protein